jgi:YegS/Rv2252/BmrU family lipid kinase
MKYCFIINPMAGKGKSVESVCSDIERVCSERQVDYEVFLSERIDDTKDHVAKRAEEGGEICFIACGGDGTLCETTLAVMALPEHLRRDVSVGVIPMGTGNDFANNFENKQLFFDISAQIDHTSYEVDLVTCNDMYSINMVNVGFDSHVVCQKEKIGRKKWVPRKLAYIISLLITLIKKPGIKAELVCDGEEAVHKELLLTTLANGAFCGGGFFSNPLASLTDGQVDVIAVKNVGRLKFLTLVGSYKKGLHLGEKFKKIVENFKCEVADMYFDREMPVSIDGELVYTSEIHLSIEQAALKFMLPKGATPKTKAPEVAAV